MRLRLKDFYAYNNFPSGHQHAAHSCGHAAILSLYNHYRIVPWLSVGYWRNTKRIPHVSSLERVYKRYPPSSLLGMKFITREKIIKAMNDVNVNVKEGYKGMKGYESPEHCYANMINWIHKYKLPVLVLLDGGVLDSIVAPGQKERWFTFHWGFIVGGTGSKVILKSWENTFTIPKSSFMKAWHCHVLPYPNNYYALYTWD